MEDGPSDEVAAFLADYVETYEQLELLLLLREHRTREWTLDEAAEAIGARTSVVEPALHALRDTGLIHQSRESRLASYRYAPRDPAWETVIAALAQAYASDRLAIVRLMNANAIERIRTAAMRTFADAFVIGKGKEKKDG